jgi:hypothetical protein
MGALPILDIITSLPDVGKHFAADVLSSRFLVGENTLGGGENGNTHSAKHLGEIVYTCVNAQARGGNSLESRNYFLILFGGILQGDENRILDSALNNLVTLYITRISAIAIFILLDGTSTVACLAVRAFLILVSISAIGSVILASSYQLAFFTPGSSPL